MITPAENAAPPIKTILLVEDDPTVCYFVERVLRNAGYYVGMAADGVSGLRLFRVRPWDIVITDRTMPGMNGEELAATIRKEAPAQPIVVIDAADRPQPGRDVEREKGMAVFVGNLRADPVYDAKFTLLVHNTIRGAAGAALLNAELLLARGLVRGFAPPQGAAR